MHPRRICDVFEGQKCIQWVQLNCAQDATKIHSNCVKMLMRCNQVAFGCTRNECINYSDVTEWFTETVKRYDLFPAWVYYDSYSARYFVEEMQLQGFNMVRCIQGAKTLSLPMQMLGADLQAHKVMYNNNPVLKWCLTNTGVLTDRNGNIVPIKNQSPKQRIDGTAALLDNYVGLYEHFTEFTAAI